MSDKYISMDGGIKKLVEANASSAGAGDAGKIVALNANGKLDDTLLPAGIGADLLVAEASEDLVAGDFVNIYDDTGTTKVRKANATNNTKPAHGFVKAGVSTGSNATVYLEGENSELSGLTVGTRYYLGTTGGAAVATAPSGSNNIVQYLGTAIATDTIRFQHEDYIQL